MYAALVDGLDGADDERAEADAEEVDVLLPLFDVVEEDTGLLDAVDAFLLSDVGEPLLEVEVFSHLPLELLLWVVFFCVSVAVVVLASVFVAGLAIASNQVAGPGLASVAWLSILVLLIRHLRLHG